MFRTLFKLTGSEVVKVRGTVKMQSSLSFTCQTLEASKSILQRYLCYKLFSFLATLSFETLSSLSFSLNKTCFRQVSIWVLLACWESLFVWLELYCIHDNPFIQHSFCTQIHDNCCISGTLVLVVTTFSSQTSSYYKKLSLFHVISRSNYRYLKDQ